GAEAAAGGGAPVPAGPPGGTRGVPVRRVVGRIAARAARRGGQRVLVIAGGPPGGGAAPGVPGGEPSGRARIGPAIGRGNRRLVPALVVLVRQVVAMTSAHGCPRFTRYRPMLPGTVAAPSCGDKALQKVISQVSERAVGGSP